MLCYFFIVMYYKFRVFKMVSLCQYDKSISIHDIILECLYSNIDIMFNKYAIRNNIKMDIEIDGVIYKVIFDSSYEYDEYGFNDIGECETWYYWHIIDNLTFEKI